MDKNVRNLAEALTLLIGVTTDKAELAKLDAAADSLRSFFDPIIGKDIWLYVGLQRDANPEMAKDYQQDILNMLRLFPESIDENTDESESQQ